jgi:hypothetical protein
MKSARALVRQVAERLHPGVGCADGACVFGSAGGMCTNGGCECLKEREPIMLRRVAMQLRDVATTLAALIPDESARKGGGDE